MIPPSPSILDDIDRKKRALDALNAAFEDYVDEYLQSQDD